MIMDIVLIGWMDGWMDRWMGDNITVNDISHECLIIVFHTDPVEKTILLPVQNPSLSTVSKFKQGWST